MRKNVATYSCMTMGYFFFCLSSIGSKWLQLKAQKQRGKVASHEKICSWKTGLRKAPNDTKLLSN